MSGLLDRILNYVAVKLPIVGTTYSASWAASASSTSGNAITQKMTLPAGTYIIIIRIPTASRSLFYQLSNISSSINQYWQIGSAGTASLIVTLASQTETQLMTADSASITWSSQNRGGVAAIRIA